MSLRSGWLCELPTTIWTFSWRMSFLFSIFLCCLSLLLWRIHRERVEKWQEEIRELRILDALNEETNAVLQNARFLLQNPHMESWIAGGNNPYLLVHYWIAIVGIGRFELNIFINPEKSFISEENMFCSISTSNSISVKVKSLAMLTDVVNKIYIQFLLVIVSC